MTEKDYNYVFIQFKVSEDFKKSVKEFADKEGFPSMSEFCRQAVEDKIRRIKHPELSQNATIDPGFMAKMIENTQRIAELQEMQRRRDKTLQSIEESLELLKDMSKSEEIEPKAQQLEDLLRAHRSLTLAQALEKTKLNESEIYLIISDDRFKINNHGRIELNEAQ